MKILSALFLLLFFVTSCTNCGNDDAYINQKALWIDQAFTTLIRQDFPQIKAISWWQEKWENEDGSISDLRINSSEEALKAFREEIANPLFVSQLNFNQQKLIPDPQGIYFSAFPDFGGSEDQVSAQSISNFESLAQKPIGWAYFSDNWYQNIEFPAQNVTTIHQAGKVPFIRMMARSNLQENQADPVYSMQNIIDGNFDNDLLQWFQQAGQTGYPLLVEFGTEVNGDWFPWNGIHNGGGTTSDYGDSNVPDGPERFRDAFRHIIDLSRQAGATNLTWFFHIDSAGQPEDAWNDFENYYPGDNYIDWVGVSVYGAITPDDDLEYFNDKLNRVYNRITNMTQKPLAILEMGVVEDIKNN